MPVVFEGAPGRIVAVPGPAVQGVLPPPLITVNAGQGQDLTFRARKSLITRVTLAHATNHQFLHAIGGDVYVYVFGDRVGEMTISGLSAAVDCDQSGDRQHGMEKMLRWYRENRLSRRRTPVDLLLGQTPVQGFVTGFQTAVFDHKLLLTQFDLSLSVVPERD